RPGVHLVVVENDDLPRQLLAPGRRDQGCCEALDGGLDGGIAVIAALAVHDVPEERVADLDLVLLAQGIGAVQVLGGLHQVCGAEAREPRTVASGEKAAGRRGERACEQATTADDEGRRDAGGPGTVGHGYSPVRHFSCKTIMGCCGYSPARSNSAICFR